MIEFPKSLREQAIKFEWQGLGKPSEPVFAVWGEQNKMGYTRIRISMGERVTAGL